MSMIMFSTDDYRGVWTDLGHAISDITFSSEPEEDFYLTDWQRRWITGMDQPRTFSMEFPISYINPRALDILWGRPIHPVKHKGLTGKAYRQACRAYQRRLKAFRRGEDWSAVT